MMELFDNGEIVLSVEDLDIGSAEIDNFCGLIPINNRELEEKIDCGRLYVFYTIDGDEWEVYLTSEECFEADDACGLYCKDRLSEGSKSMIMEAVRREFA